MEKYLMSLVAKIETKDRINVKPQLIPFVPESKIRKLQEEAEANGTTAEYGDEATSPTMAGLYSARSCRPDLSVPTLRLARRATRWDPSDDARILQYLGYI